VQVEYRLRVQKIDMDAYYSSNGLQPFFIVSAGSVTTNVSVNLGVFVDHNVSFVGDAVQPPPTSLQKDIEDLKKFVHFKSV